MKPIRWVLMAAFLCVPLKAQGQWGVSAEAGIFRFAGASTDTNDLSVHPYHSTAYGLGLDREIGPVRVALEGRYAKTGLGGEGKGVAIVFYDVLSLIEVAPLVSWRLARFEDLSFRIEAGPIGSVWRFEDEEPRFRAGARLGASVEWPLLRRLNGSIRVAQALSPTVFEEYDFDEEGTVELRSTWRTSVALALRYRL